jgi:Domain of unknown function (DUF5658)
VNLLRRYLSLRSPRLGAFGVRVLFWLLCALWLLNVADLTLTSYGIWLGFASESNGVMRYFLHQGTVTAAVFKIGIITVGALMLWRLRRYRSALTAAVLLAGVFAAVVAYQALWLASL